MQATHTTSPSPGLSEGMMKGFNKDFQFSPDNYLLSRMTDPDFLVYIYNVNIHPFEIARPGMFRKILIPGRKPGEKYALAVTLPHPLITQRSNVDTNQIEMVAQDARRVAADLLNPDNLSAEESGQDALVVNPTSIGCNLNRYGVFWSRNNPPTEDEVNKATARMEKEFTRVLEEARVVTMSSTDPRILQETITPIHHMAADFFKQEFSWHKAQIKPTELMTCPQCREDMPVDAAFHTTKAGSKCVLDIDKAIRAFFISRAQAFDATGDPKYAPRTSQPEEL
jgi:hypothetical protein